MARERDGNVLLEFTPVGAITRVSAIDAATNIEVTIQGPTSAGKTALTRTAIAKLNYVLSRRQEGAQGQGQGGLGQGAQGQASAMAAPPPRSRGIQV